MFCFTDAGYSIAGQTGHQGKHEIISDRSVYFDWSVFIWFSLSFRFFFFCFFISQSVKKKPFTEVEIKGK